MPIPVVRTFAYPRASSRPIASSTPAPGITPRHRRRARTGSTSLRRAHVAGARHDAVAPNAGLARAESPHYPGSGQSALNSSTVRPRRVRTGRPGRRANQPARPAAVRGQPPTPQPAEAVATHVLFDPTRQIFLDVTDHLRTAISRILPAEELLWGLGWPRSPID